MAAISATFEPNRNGLGVVKDWIAVSRPRFSCYSPVCTGSAGQAPGGKVARRQGGQEARKVERTYIDVLFPLGR